MLRNPRFWLPTLSLGAVLWLLYLDLDSTSPGPITLTHAQVPELLESTSCKLCHGDSEETLAEACSACHTAIGEDLETATGFHGTLATADPQDCGHCHAEHHGEEFRLVTEKSFALAGLESRAAFDHAAIDFTIEGSHAELGCVECHQNANLLMIPQGEHRFIGLDRACVACHDDVHEGKIVRDCASCHGQAHPFAEVAVFEHERFIAEGAHVGPGCMECHVPDSERSVEVVAGPDPPRSERVCADCHDSPHSQAFLVGVGELENTRPRKSCRLCHAAAHEDFAGLGDAMPAELHAAAGFSLELPHDDVGCDECHARTDDVADFAALFPGRKADDCATCHEDVHAGQFAGGPFGACLDCHDRHAFTPPAFDLAQHARTSFELVGSHESVACAACHLQPNPDEPRVFAEAPSSCASCHEDPHRGAFAESCDHCHEVSRFAEFQEDIFDHERFTAFALDGAHARAECATCHIPAATPDSSGRSFGFVSDVFGQPVDACSTCHADPHEDTFEREGVAARIDGHEGCARCHVTESFHKPALESFDHELWTGYRLDGAHERARCTTCHQRSEQPDENGRTFGRIDAVFGQPVDDCRTCHTDPHRGAFDGTSCSQCHTTETFGELATGPFDHAQWADYPLADFHAVLDCTECHVPTGAESGYRALGPAAGTACSDCHADPHVGQFADNRRTDCARCHLDAGGLSFDHQRDSRYALDETHAELDCSACHMPWPIPGGLEAIRYKPLGIECADCHGPHGGVR